jgi:cytochrome P450
VEALHGKIQRLTDDLLDAALERGSMEVISDLAFPVSITVIAEMLGVPPSDGNLFRRWSEEFAVRADMEISEETFRRTSQVTIEFANYLRDLVQERRRQPREDLLSMLVAVEEQGDRLTEEELVATAMILLVAGNQTSASLIGNGTYALLRFPDQMQKLKENPALVKTAIEEFLRFESPVQVAARFVMEDFEYRGQAFRRGQQVTAALAAANRDPEQFANPDTVDITRENNKHLAFGNGIHFCLGAPLARLEGQTVFTTLVRRLPKLQLAAESVAYRPIYSLRILQSLPVTV